MVYKDIKYSKIMESSLETLKKNKIIFLPNILMVLISVFLLWILYNVSGLQELLTLKPFILDDKIVFGEELARLFMTPRFATSTIIWFIAEILLGAYFVVMKYGMIKDVILHGRTSFKSGMEFADKNYLRYWGVHIMSYLLIYGPLFILLGLYTLFIKYNVPSINFSYLILGIFILVWFVYSLLMFVRIFYIYPVMTFERESVFKVFDDDFHYVKTHLGHTFLSILIFLAVVIGWVFLKDQIDIFSASIRSAHLITIITLVMLALEILVTTWEHVFIFRSYEEGKKIKKATKEASNAKAKKKKKAK